MEFREIRRADRSLDAKRVEEILANGSHGVLAVIGDNDYPYGVPLSYTYRNNKIYFHCATEGHKIDAIRKNPKVCFTVIEQDNVKPEQMGTDYSSVVAFGTARVLEDENEMVETHKYVIDKYLKDFEEKAIKYMHASMPKMLMVEIVIDHVTGKAKGSAR